MSATPGAREPGVAALPVAATLTLWSARALPVRFGYEPDAFGIASLTSEARYPVEQETFWLVFAVGFATLATWLVSRALLRARPPPGSAAGAEALGAASLLCALWLAPPLAELGAALALAGVAALAGRAGAASPAAPARAPAPAPALAPARRGWRGGLWPAGSLLVSSLLVPAFWLDVWHVAQGVPDEQLVRDNFLFLGESGQHLAWANALWRGGFQGRDVFCLYGPLYDLGVVGLWGLVGRSVVAWNLYASLGRVLGWWILLLLGGALLRRRALALALPLLLPWTDLRTGLALLGLLWLLPFLRTGRPAWCAASGAAGGASLLYSQEFGLAFLLVAVLTLAVRRDPRAAALFGAGLLAVAAPLLATYAAHGALLPMLKDLALYPTWLMAGYANIPFPQLLPSLPLDLAELGSRPFLELRLGYATPAVYVAALALALPLSAVDLRRLLSSLGAALRSLSRDPERLAAVALALFGLIAFRSALGRSSLHRTHAVLPAAALLLVMAADRLVDLGGSRRGLAAWRGAALAAFVACAGFAETARPLEQVATSLRNAQRKLSGLYRPVGDAHVNRVTRWVRRNTGPVEPVLFLPNDAAYYYLTDRRSPIRFVLGSQIVTESHRAEVLGDLRAEPPRFALWDDGALRVDDLPDELVFGRALLDWIDAHYEEVRRFGGVRVLRYRGSSPRGGASGGARGGW